MKASTNVRTLLESYEDELKDLALSVPLRQFKTWEEVYDLVQDWPETEDRPQDRDRLDPRSALYFVQTFPAQDDLPRLHWDGQLSWGYYGHGSKPNQAETIPFFTVFYAFDHVHPGGMIECQIGLENLVEIDPEQYKRAVRLLNQATEAFRAKLQAARIEFKP